MVLESFSLFNVYQKSSGVSEGWGLLNVFFIIIHSPPPPLPPLTEKKDFTLISASRKNTIFPPVDQMLDVLKCDMFCQALI